VSTAIAAGSTGTTKDLLVTVYHPDATDHHRRFVGPPQAYADWIMKFFNDNRSYHQHCITTQLRNRRRHRARRKLRGVRLVRKARRQDRPRSAAAAYIDRIGARQRRVAHRPVRQATIVSGAAGRHRRM
jgi:hypothetical protein